MASMLRAMYCGSRLMPLGLTTTCCSTSGHTPPISTLDSTSRPSAMAGSLIDRVNAPTTKPTAQIAAISIRMSLAGSTALTSVYEAPVKVPPRLENSSSYRSYQYCTALSSTNAADQQGQLQRRLRGDLAPGTGQPDAAEQVLDDRDRDEADRDDHEQPAEHQLDHRQGEDVEADVVAELRIGRAEVAAVQPQLHGRPVRLRGQPADQPDQAGDAEGEELRAGA